MRSDCAAVANKESAAAIAAENATIFLTKAPLADGAAAVGAMLALADANSNAAGLRFGKAACGAPVKVEFCHRTRLSALSPLL